MSSHVPSQSPWIDSDAFRQTCAKFAAGVTITTVQGKGETPYGITVNSFTSVSCVPPLVLVCIDYCSSILPHFRTASYFGVNVLHESQQEFSVRFSQRELDRFEGVDWRFGIHGVPLIEGVIAQLECAVTQIVEAGDHAIFLGEVVDARFWPGPPLLYFGSDYARCVPGG